MSYAHGRNTAKAQLGLEKVAYNAKMTQRIMDAMRRAGMAEASDLRTKKTELHLPEAAKKMLAGLLPKGAGGYTQRARSAPADTLEQSLRDFHPLRRGDVLPRAHTRALREAAASLSTPPDQMRQQTIDAILGDPQARKAVRTMPAELQLVRDELGKMKKTLSKKYRKKADEVLSEISDYRSTLKGTSRADIRKGLEGDGNKPGKILGQYIRGATDDQLSALPRSFKVNMRPVDSSEDLLGAAGRVLSPSEVRREGGRKELTKGMPKQLRRGLRSMGGSESAPFERWVGEASSDSPTSSGTQRAYDMLKGTGVYRPSGPSAEDFDRTLMSGRHVANKSPVSLQMPDQMTRFKRKDLERLPGFNPQETLWRGGEGPASDKLKYGPGTAVFGSAIPGVSAGYGSRFGEYLAAYNKGDFQNPPVRFTPHLAKNVLNTGNKKLKTLASKGQRAGRSPVGSSPYYEAVVDAGELNAAKPKALYQNLNAGHYLVGGEDLLRQPPLRPPKKKP